MTAIYANCCFRYHKGTDFQANHNQPLLIKNAQSVVLDTTKVLIFKQITTCHRCETWWYRCFRYHKGTDFQANHNYACIVENRCISCFRYHKGTDFQANHNIARRLRCSMVVVLDTTKVLIFKQITTDRGGRQEQR